MREIVYGIIDDLNSYEDTSSKFAIFKTVGTIFLYDVKTGRKLKELPKGNKISLNLDSVNNVPNRIANASGDALVSLNTNNLEYAGLGTVF